MGITTITRLQCYYMRTCGAAIRLQKRLRRLHNNNSSLTPQL